MVFWKKSVHRNGWGEEDEQDPKFKPTKKTDTGTYGKYTKSNGEDVSVKEVKQGNVIYYRLTNPQLDDEEFL